MFINGRIKKKKNISSLSLDSISVLIFRSIVSQIKYRFIDYYSICFFFFNIFISSLLLFFFNKAYVFATKLNGKTLVLHVLHKKNVKLCNPIYCKILRLSDLFFSYTIYYCNRIFKIDSSFIYPFIKSEIKTKYAANCCYKQTQ